MDTIFMNSESNKTFKPNALKLKLKEVKKILHYQILVFIMHGKT